MFWRDEERKEFCQKNPMRFAEVAHQYRCCDVPTIKKCVECAYLPEQCRNKAEILEILRNLKGEGKGVSQNINQTALQKNKTWECMDCGTPVE
jgi:hypothetical protein